MRDHTGWIYSANAFLSQIHYPLVLGICPGPLATHHVGYLGTQLFLQADPSHTVWFLSVIFTHMCFWKNMFTLKDSIGLLGLMSWKSKCRSSLNGRKKLLLSLSQKTCYIGKKLLTST